MTDCRYVWRLFWYLSRRDNRTQPGVLTPGYDPKNSPPQRGGREFYPSCPLTNESPNLYLSPLQHLQPATRVQLGLGAILQHSSTPARNASRSDAGGPSLRVAGFEDEDEYEAPGEGGRPGYLYPGLKPRAESCCPFGTDSHRSLRYLAAPFNSCERLTNLFKEEPPNITHYA